MAAAPRRLTAVHFCHREGFFHIDTRTLMAYGLAVLLGLAIAGTIAFFRYNSARQKHRRGRAQDHKREQALRADHAQRRTDHDA